MRYRFRSPSARCIFSLVILGLFLSPLFLSPSLAQTTYGPQAVWNPPQEAMTQIQDCYMMAGGDEAACVIAIMQEEGAAPAAIELIRTLNGLAFLIEFEEMGTVDKGLLLYPGRANDNWQPVLLNGIPSILIVPHEVDVDIRQDPNYPALVAEYPELTMWSGDNRFAGEEPRPEGGQRFIFSFNLVDGCHACDVAGTAQVAFDFDASGRFLGSELLSLMPMEAPPPSGELGIISYVDSNGNVSLTRDDGSSPQQISTSGQDCCPTWSPDGSKLYFIRNAGEAGSIVEFDFSQNEESILGPTGRNVAGGVAISPDGQKLAFAYNEPITPQPGEILLIENRACLAMLALESGDYADVRCDNGIFLEDIVFSPSGLEVLGVVDGFEYTAVHAYPLDGAPSERVAWGREPDFYPDGNAVVTAVGSYYFRTHLIPSGSAYGIFKTDLATGAETLVLDSDQDLGSPHISADGMRLLYVHGRRIEIRDLNSGNTSFVINGNHPVWRPAVDILELAERFAPKLYYHEFEAYGNPISIEPVLLHATLKRDIEPDHGPPLTIDDLLENPWNTDDNTFIDLLGDDRMDTEEKYNSTVCPGGCQPIVYARVTDPDPETGRRVIQYWLFYYANPHPLYPLGNYHEGDWEMVQVVLDAAEQPIYAAYAQHECGSKRLWGSVPKEEGTQHPRVYVAQGSHASYFSPGLRTFRCDNLPPWFDIAGDKLLRSPLGVRLIPKVIDPASEDEKWLTFQGHWGAEGSIIPGYGGPRGPRFQGQKWDYPVVWPLSLDWDEDAQHNIIGNLRASVSAPLDVRVEEQISSPLDEASMVEHFDNAFTGRRTMLVYQVKPDGQYEVQITYRAIDGEPASQPTARPLSLTINFSDLQANRVITAAYSLENSWDRSATGTVLVSHDSDFVLRVDTDGDGMVDRELPPSAVEEAPADLVPPADVSDLVATAGAPNSVTLSWTAPGDDGMSGTAAGYDIRHYHEPITVSNWVSATQVVDDSVPTAGGLPESLTVSQLELGTHYFALLAFDDAQRLSALSNVAAAEVLPVAPALPTQIPTNEATAEVLAEAPPTQALPIEAPPATASATRDALWRGIAILAISAVILVVVGAGLFVARHNKMLKNSSFGGSGQRSRHVYCPQCGTQYPPTGKFCIKCGRPRG
jgi:hypothetical protein